MGRLAFIFAAITCATGVGPNLANADESSDAVALVEQVRQTALELARGGSAALIARETKAIRAAFDGPSIGRVVLGAYWASATIRERAEFVDALLDVSTHRLADRLAGATDQAFVVLGSQVLPNGDLLVKSKFSRAIQEPTTVDWRLHHCQNALCIVDVVVNGASVSLQRRDDVAAQMAASGGSIAKVTTDLHKDRAGVAP